jgi:hypothetical protein
MTTTTITSTPPQHTPGPWEVDPSEYSDMIWTAGSPYGQDKMHIADVRGWGHLTGRGSCAFSDANASKIMEANARLIAAAPELLAELERLVTYFGPDRGPAELRAKLNDARAAITKAKGNTP